MKQYSLRYLYKHLGKALKHTPFIITNHNRGVALVSDIDAKLKVVALESNINAKLVNNKFVKEDNEKS